VENGTKAGHSLLMDARDLVLKVSSPVLPLLLSVSVTVLP
jgi:hypothetical protein